MLVELIWHCVKAGTWDKWDGESVPCVRLSSVSDTISSMRRSAWTAGHHYWRASAMVPDPLSGVITTSTVDQYLVGLNLGINIGRLTANR